MLNYNCLTVNKFQARHVTVSVGKSGNSLLQYKGASFAIITITAIIDTIPITVTNSPSPLKGNKPAPTLRPTAPVHRGRSHGGGGGTYPVPSHHCLVREHVGQRGQRL